MKSAEKLVEIQNLVTTFNTEEGRVTAVDGISFSLDRGIIQGIVGESGSGKSVTALSLLRLLPTPPALVTADAIHLFRVAKPPVRLDLLTEKEMRLIRGREISMVFQEPMTSLNPVYTCGTQVAEVLKLHLGLSRKEAREKTLSLFEEVRLPRPEKIYSSYPHEISGGQKQRVMIAMAVACDPVLLIADEPTTALDVSVQKTILELLHRLRESRGMSILFITHDLGLVQHFADRVMVMYKGKIVEEGSSEEVFTRPGHPYTRGLIACRPPADRRLRRLPTVGEYLDREADGMPSVMPAVESPAEREDRHRELYTREPVLVAEAITKEYASGGGLFAGKRTHFRALETVTVPVYSGETLGIVGESGSGKTTLARVVLQLIPASSGRILFRGADITSLTRARMKQLRKQIQIVFQDPYSSLDPRETVGNAILEPMRVHGLHGTDALRREKTIELLEKVGLGPAHFSRYPHEFSGGQRQRICIARALAVEPELIILDEAVSALDVSVQAQVLNLLNTLREEFGLTYLFISHDLAVVRYMSDRILVMKDGHIVETAEADALCRRPETEYTRMLLNASSLTFT